MASFDIQPRRDGATLTLISDDRKSAVSEDFDLRAAEQFVRMFCHVAGLPEPWKKG
jgi:hypothetical protein